MPLDTQKSTFHNIYFLLVVINAAATNRCKVKKAVSLEVALEESSVYCICHFSPHLLSCLYTEKPINTTTINNLLNIENKKSAEQHLEMKTMFAFSGCGYFVGWQTIFVSIC